MADNVILTPQIFAKLVLMNLGNNLHVCSNMSHEVTKEFAQKGNKVGAEVQVRRPYRFNVAKGLTYQPQPIVDTVLPVRVSQVAQVAYDWDSVEKTLSVREADQLYAKPAGIALASQINAEAATFCADETFNSVGTPGTTPTTTQTYLSAGDLLYAQGLPNGEDLTCIINRKFSSSFIFTNQALFNPAGNISHGYKEGEIGPDPTLGYRWERDQTINTHTVGVYAGSPVVSSANQTGEGGNNGTMTLATSGWSSSTLNRGDKFTIGSASDGTAVVGGVQSVYPQGGSVNGGGKPGTGYQQYFTVTLTTSDSSGAMSIPIRPAITPSGQYQNVDAAAVNNAIITVIGTSGKTCQQGLLMHKTAFAFVSVPLTGPGPGEGAVVAMETDPETGISLRMLKAFDYVHSVHINRIDVLYDFSGMYRELSTVIQG